MSPTCHLCGGSVTTLDDATDDTTDDATDDTTDDATGGFECADCGEVTCPDCRSIGVGRSSDHCRRCRG